jgi:hypothetical protein
MRGDLDHHQFAVLARKRAEQARQRASQLEAPPPHASQQRRRNLTLVGADAAAPASRAPADPGHARQPATTKAAIAAAIRADQAHERVLEISRRLAELRQLGQHTASLQDARSRYETAQERARLARERARDAALRDAATHERAAARHQMLGDTNHAEHHRGHADAARQRAHAHRSALAVAGTTARMAALPG